MKIPENCRYNETHEWIRIDGDEALIGISEFAQGELGDIVYVELPDVGTELGAGDECGMIDSAKTTSPIINPIAGTVIRINDNLADHPELLNQSPFEEGWMYAIEPVNPADIENLMDAEAYKKHIT